MVIRLRFATTVVVVRSGEEASELQSLAVDGIEDRTTQEHTVRAKNATERMNHILRHLRFIVSPQTCCPTIVERCEKCLTFLASLRVLPSIYPSSLPLAGQQVWSGSGWGAVSDSSYGARRCNVPHG